MFDPTWFPYEKETLKKQLKEQSDFKKDAKLSLATGAYIEFLDLGGELKFEDLTRDLLRKYLYKDIPILTGTNANFLYRSAREFGPDSLFDSIRGEPCGHFVLLCGYDRENKIVTVVDPLLANPFSTTQRYEIAIDRVIASILLGIITYDANFLIIEPIK